MKKANITPKVSTSYEVGAILVDTWGCEQTNHDFYVIIEIANGWVKVLPLKKNVVSEGELTMTTKDTPGEIDTTKKPIRKKLKMFDGEISGFSFRDYTGGGWCKLWNGKVKFSSHYA